MIGGAARPARYLHLVGTIGEIQGCIEDSRFVVRSIDPRPGHEYAERVVELDAVGDISGALGWHGGSDLKLVQYFIEVIRGGKPSISSTSIEDSIAGHSIGFAADRSRE